jgi:predicted XRE-type DNA-binding protein
MLFRRNANGHQHPEGRRGPDTHARKTAKKGFAMNNEEMALVRGSGHVFRDFGNANADAEQLRAMLAAQIIQALDERGLTLRAVESLTGIAAADLSRIRRANLGRFTIDRLISILNRLNRKVDVTVTVQPFSSRTPPMGARP